MARRPVDTIASAPRPQGRDAIWSAIRALRTFCLADVEHRARVPFATIQSYCRGLTRAGYLARVPDPRPGVAVRHQRAYWTLVRDVGREPPRVTKTGSPVTQGRAREQMWTTMRVLKTFTFVDLVFAASTDDCQIGRADATKYCQLLAKAGYLQVVARGKCSHPAVYRLIKITGPRAPLVQRGRAVFDPNINQVVWSREVSP